jgi:hypothetical protein
MEKSESYKAFTAGKVKSCIWSDHWGEMAKKTVIKRLFKYLPKTDKFEHMAQAVAALDEDYIISDNQIDYLLNLLETTGYDEDAKKVYRYTIENGLTGIEFNQLKNNFEMNQVDRINSGLNYNQTDISKKIASEISMPETK